MAHTIINGSCTTFLLNDDKITVRSQIADEDVGLIDATDHRACKLDAKNMDSNVLNETMQFIAFIENAHLIKDIHSHFVKTDKL